MSEHDFELDLQRTLAADAERAVRPVDALAIAGAAMAPSARAFRWSSFAPLVAAALIGAAIIAGAGLLAGSRNPAPLRPPALVEAPSSSGTPSASPAPTVPEAVAGVWVGGIPPVAGAPEGLSSAILEMTDPATVGISRRGEDGDTYRSRAAWSDSTLRISTLLADSCAPGDNGYYSWSVSPGGSLLLLTANSDPCSPRAEAFSRTWYRLGCAAWSMNCLGRLEPGTYPSWNFATSLDANKQWHPRLGALSYTVAEGWTNSNDFSAGYWLEPTPWHDALVEARGGQDTTDRTVSNGIYVLSRPVAAIQDDNCTSSLPDPSVGETAQDLVDFLTHHPALAASPPQPITIGPIEGQFVDVELAPTWTKTCPGLTAPLAALITSKNGSPALGWNDAGTNSGAFDRYIVLDLGGGRPVLIQVSAPSSAEFQSLLPQAMRVVETFRFSP